MRRVCLVLGVSLVAASCAGAGATTGGVTSASAPGAAGESTSGVGSLRWLQGTWRRAEASGAVTEESWGAPEGGTMLGTGRVLRGGHTVFFEFLAIRESGDSLVYTAWPRGSAPTEFRVTSRGAGHVTFENPEHDFPRRIEYRRAGDGAVDVRIDGIEGGRPQSEAYTLRAVR